MVPKFINANIIGSKWIYRIKHKSDGSIEHYKVQLVAQGSTQKFDLDYKEIFSSVIKVTTIWTILAIATMENCPMRQLDVFNVFFHGLLLKKIYVA